MTFTKSLVPQVSQINRDCVEEISKAALESGETLTLEEAMQYPSFQYGAGVNDLVIDLWSCSEVIVRSGLPVPYCMYSKNDDDSWNFSWGLDFAEKQASTRSCFYTIFSNADVKCREYPGDILAANNIMNRLLIALVIVSDLLQSHEWGQEETLAELGKLLVQRNESSKTTA